MFIASVLAIGGAGHAIESLTDFDQMLDADLNPVPRTTDPEMAELLDAIGFAR